MGNYARSNVRKVKQPSRQHTIHEENAPINMNSYAHEMTKVYEHLSHDKGVSKQLPEGLKARLQGHFGVNTNSLKISESEEASKLGVEAYTKGNAIKFAPGKFNPDTKHGQEVIGHEVAHVVQQLGGNVKHDIGAFNLDAHFENEAHEAGRIFSDNYHTMPMQMTSVGLLDASTVSEVASPMQGFDFLSSFKRHKKPEEEKNRQESSPQSKHKLSMAGIEEIIGGSVVDLITGGDKPTGLEEKIANLEHKGIDFATKGVDKVKSKLPGITKGVDKVKNKLPEITTDIKNVFKSKEKIEYNKTKKKRIEEASRAASQRLSWTGAPEGRMIDGTKESEPNNKSMILEGVRGKVRDTLGINELQDALEGAETGDIGRTLVSSVDASKKIASLGVSVLGKIPGVMDFTPAGILTDGITTGISAYNMASHGYKFGKLSGVKNEMEEREKKGEKVDKTLSQYVTHLRGHQRNEGISAAFDTVQGLASTGISIANTVTLASGGTASQVTVPVAVACKILKKAASGAGSITNKILSHKLDNEEIDNFAGIDEVINQNEEERNQIKEQLGKKQKMTATEKRAYKRKKREYMKSENASRLIKLDRSILRSQALKDKGFDSDNKSEAVSQIVDIQQDHFIKKLKQGDKDALKVAQINHIPTDIPDEEIKKHLKRMK